MTHVTDKYYHRKLYKAYLAADGNRGVHVCFLSAEWHGHWTKMTLNLQHPLKYNICFFRVVVDTQLYDKISRLSLFSPLYSLQINLSCTSPFSSHHVIRLNSRHEYNSNIAHFTLNNRLIGHNDHSYSTQDPFLSLIYSVYWS